jgi:hypothetical protein
MSMCQGGARMNSGISLAWSAIPLMQHGTDYGRMMAIYQILNGQYHIWEIFGLGLKIKVHPKYPKFIRRICQISPKVWDIVEKRLHRASVVCATRSLHQDYNNICSLEQNVYCTATALEIIGPTEVARP